MYKEFAIGEIIPLVRRFLSYYPANLPAPFLEVPIPQLFPFTIENVIEAIDRADAIVCNHLYAMIRRQAMDGDFDPIDNFERLVDYCETQRQPAAAGASRASALRQSQCTLSRGFPTS